MCELQRNVTHFVRVQEKGWDEKALKSLAKKLKRTNLLEELERAIVSQDPNSACIPIAR